VKLTEPGCDLAVAVALASAITGKPMAQGLVVCGEIGLAGELRQAPNTPRRLAEAARLGFSHAVVPHTATADVDGIKVWRAERVDEVLARLTPVTAP
jgi:DNA repair protein RadA/Sms